MPFVNVKITRDGVTTEQKAQIVAEITATLQRVLGKRPELTHIVIDEVDLEHPIILDVEGRVMDGMHRVARALRDGHMTVRAVRFEVQPPPDFVDCQPRNLPYEE